MRHSAAILAKSLTMAAKFSEASLTPTCGLVALGLLI